MSKTTIFYKDIAPGAEEDAEIAATGATEFSDLSKLPKGVTPAPTLTCEINHWILNGTYELVEKEQAAFWSTELSWLDG